MSRIHLLQVKHGDSFVIECDKDDQHGIIVVDGGPMGCGYILQNKIKKLGIPDLMILTHYDDDHIGGILQFVSSCIDDADLPAKEIWANCAGFVKMSADKALSAKQGVKLSNILDKLSKNHGLIWKGDIYEGYVKDFPFACFEVISPTKEVMGMAIKKQQEEGHKYLKATKKNEDYLKVSLEELVKHQPEGPDLGKDNELANAASISFILRCDNLSILMLGDSYPQNVEDYLRKKGFSEENPLIVDYVKVSHHGSRNNTNNELLDIIKCNNYIISTNGGKNASNHPDRTAIAHILCHPRRNIEEKVHLFFNYRLEIIENNGTPFINENEKESYNFEIHENITVL